MTNETIERKVARWIEHANWLLAAGTVDQATYDATMRDLCAWVDHAAKPNNRGLA